MHGVALLAATALAGVGVGIFTGLLGVGGGFVIVPYLVVVAGISQHSAQGTSLVSIVPIALVAAVSLLHGRTLDPHAALRIATTGVLASVAGAALALSLPSGVLRVVFAVGLGAVGLHMLVGALRAR